MEISPNNPRDYAELIQAYEKKYKIDIEKIIENELPEELLHSDTDGIFLILKSILSINIKEYNCLLQLAEIDNRILYLYKLIVYDYFDYYQSRNAFCGVQEYSVVRSLCNHSRIFIRCLCDKDFLEFYFSEYTENEKKDRYYKKRETNISKRLIEIAEEARKLNNDIEFFAESAIFNLTTELYEDLTDKLGELSHLTEITMAKKFVSMDEKLDFSALEKQEKLKFDDEILEYLILTTLTTALIFMAEEVVFDETVYELFNFLNYLSIELFKFRNIDKLLVELKKKTKEILMSDENEMSDM